MLKVSDIREFIRLLDETSIHELHIETEELKLTLKKSDAAQVVHTAPALVQSQQAIAPLPANVVSSASTVNEENVAAAPQADADTALITSPMVGTFYSAPSPKADPYVEVGAKVTEKTVVCIVEAMKLMNEIEADARGQIIEILAENGQLVEYGQPLFRIKSL